jgi:hypothetical protein
MHKRLHPGQGFLPVFEIHQRGEFSSLLEVHLQASFFHFYGFSYKGFQDGI